ncbi:MAG: site-specific integrase, partial [Actinobacteria bacterium]|nr:site-specific integrase [Actinomycetota bacterium]
MDLLNQFKSFLLSQKDVPSKVTVKNYLSDINHFIRWYEHEYQKAFSPALVNGQTIERYKNTNSEVFSQSSMDRHVSSLRKFFKFLKLEGLNSANPFELSQAQALNANMADPWHIKDFKNYLYVYNASHLTIKNYIIDVKQFLAWAEEISGLKDANQSQKENFLNTISPSLLEEYKERLVKQGSFSPATVNRKLSSLRKYLSWAIEEKYISGINHTLTNVAAAENNTKEELQRLMLGQTAEEPIAEPEIKQDYSRIPPVRFFQKIGKAGVFTLD